MVANKSGPVSFSPTGINSGGLTSTFGPDGNVSVAPSADRTGLVNNISSTFGDQANAIGGLASQVAPGNSAFLQSQLAALNNAKTASISNLSDNLARRRVLGSSFGQDAISRSNADFGQAAAQQTAQSFLQSIDQTNQLISQQYTAKRQQFQTGLDEMNLEANVAAGLAGKASDQLGANARLLTQLNAQQAQAAGSFFGTAFQPLTKALGTGASNMFGGGSNIGNGGGGGSLVGLSPSAMF